jgi:uncharacterized protein (DUF4415 family)
MSLAKHNKGKGKTPPKFEDQGTLKKDEETPVPATEKEVVQKTSNSIEELVSGVIDKPKPNPKRQISVYIDEQVAKEFEKFGKKHGKGAKSDLINNFLKKAFSI